MAKVRPRFRSGAARRGASPVGHGIGVNRLSPVDFVKARNAAPSGPSESKSMISRWRSSGSAPGAAADS